MRRKLIGLFVFTSLVFLLICNLGYFQLAVFPTSHYVTDYYLAHYQDTGSFNAVTAIYLDYRVFDTLFETLLLVVSVIAIIYFSRHEQPH